MVVKVSKVLDEVMQRMHEQYESMAARDGMSVEDWLKSEKSNLFKLPENQSCANCRFFRNVDHVESGIALGECVRFPPTYMQHRVPMNHEGGTSADYFSGPVVRSSDWCGEHRQ